MSYNAILLARLDADPDSDNAKSDSYSGLNFSRAVYGALGLAGGSILATVST